MRHLNAGRKFGRNTSSRRAMLRNLAANLITHERIETTDAKAKELRRVAERLISKAVRLGDVAYTKPAEEAPADPAKARELQLNRARRLHVERLLRRFLPRFATIKSETDGVKRIDLIEKVLVELSQRYQGRPGGYTRIIKIGLRRGDNAPMSLIEFVGQHDSARGVIKAKREKAAAAVAAETPAT